ncbi:MULTISPECIES: long-chain fatty acid--CoA ligase [unclassified Rhodococcus (in: high G+C Gram-positive bacteria)]|uniref:AMP-dependent synthetase/ligase n=1 Tax=unclassified Rhodococcus (in: high G+C Gram-positive bacteria) TaxID=192944 RepID=UPI00146A665A|nr:MULTISPECIES: long-chain fatty acid--CoA ligase [unclassified Rhodococcus (in: high G+C Gram-positive bacteria)]MBF0662201.1 long-chain fatty acid--CoA ligase [Rhodococcus sp. (in: high G+C Gram-positive bacteria)]NME79446.1 long-chain fatty acid--CoA ligase [Rhodococcus sp. 105337]
MTSRLDSPSTLCEAFQSTAAAYPDHVALRTPDDSVHYTWREYSEKVRALAAGLAGLGVRHGDTVGIMLTNRPEFHLVDTAAFHLGAVPFSIYNSLTAEQITYVLGNAGNRVMICEEQFVPVLQQAIGETKVEHLVCIDAKPDGTLSLEDVEAAADESFDFEAAWKAVQPSDLLTLIYTSGTTGPPKGVELTHANLLAELAATTTFLPTGPDDRIVSYLPDAHIANRWGSHYSSIYSGMQITTLDDLKKAIAVLPSVRPTLFGAVPQVWYKVKAAIDKTLAEESSPVKKRLAFWAIEVGRKVARLQSEGKPVPKALELQHALADKLVLSAVRKKLGLDQVRAAVTGAAAISPEVLEFVLALGIPCSEVWGMSETSCVVTMNRPGKIRIGTVGQAVPGVEIKTADDGELLVRGPLIMRGYRNDPVKTAEAVDPDGWLHTGDIARIDEDGYVTLIDRKKELIVNAAGKNMSPTNIEGALRAACPMLGGAVVIGNDRPYIVALLALDPDALPLFAEQHGLSGSHEELAQHPAVLAEIEQSVKEANTKLSRVEQIKKYTVLSTVWEPSGDELTPTMKLKRKPIDAKYAEEIDALYVTA